MVGIRKVCEQTNFDTFLVSNFDFLVVLVVLLSLFSILSFPTRDTCVEGKCKIDKNVKNDINTNKKTKFDTKNVPKIVFVTYTAALHAANRYRPLCFVTLTLQRR